jgi:hypothetical protein
MEQWQPDMAGWVFLLILGDAGRFSLTAVVVLLLQEFVDAEAEYFAGYGFEFFNDLRLVLHFLGIFFGQTGG